MIVEAIINGFLDICIFLFGNSPLFDFTIDLGIFELFLDLLVSVAYLLPWGTVVAIVTIQGGILAFKLFVSIIKTVWGILPFT